MRIITSPTVQLGLDPQYPSSPHLTTNQPATDLPATELAARQEGDRRWFPHSPRNRSKSEASPLPRQPRHAYAPGYRHGLPPGLKPARAATRPDVVRAASRRHVRSHDATALSFTSQLRLTSGVVPLHRLSPHGLAFSSALLGQGTRFGRNWCHISRSGVSPRRACHTKSWRAKGRMDRSKLRPWAGSSHHRKRHRGGWTVPKWLNYCGGCGRTSRSSQQIHRQKWRYAGK